MTHIKIEREHVNIYQCPRAEIIHTAQITLGDLHANAMLLMYFLVFHGVFKISDEHYAQLKNIYSQDMLAKSDIAEFNQIIESLEVGEKPYVRLIGDEICDRGKNDYFIFKILDTLKTNGIKTEILLSNHSLEFLIPYEQKKILAAPNIDMNGQTRSLNNMRRLIEEEVISRKLIDELINRSYAPSLKLISYSLDGNSITLYSHAGIGLETIKALADKFQAEGVEYNDNTLVKLAGTIDQINAVFFRHVQSGTIHTLPVRLNEGTQAFSETDPVTFLLWNRSYENLSRKKVHNGYSVYYVHGHDSQELTHENIINLDGILGKSDLLNVGVFRALAAYNPVSG